MFSQSPFGVGFSTSIFKTIPKSLTPTLLAIALLLTTLTSLQPITILAQSTADKAGVYKAEVENIREKKRLEIVASSREAAKTELTKKAGELDIAGSCIDPIGWSEIVSPVSSQDPKPDPKSQNSTSYNVPKNRKIPSTHKPGTNPESFVVVVCNSTDKINYLDKGDGTYKKIDNTIRVTTGTNTKQAGLDYAYTNTANDFKAYFHRDPSLGWLFESGETVMKVVRIEVGGAGNAGKSTPLAVNPAILSGNTVTYPNILPDVDLRYTVTNRGVSKFFILKSKEALKNDLSRITYTLDNATNLNIQKTEETVKLVEKKEQEVKAIIITPTTKETLQKDLETLKTTNNQTTVKSLEVKDKTGKLAGVSIGRPVTYDSSDISKNVVTGVEKVETPTTQTTTTTPTTPTKATNPLASILENGFDISKDGRVMNIYTDKAYLTSPARVFPIVIDPETVGTGPMADTWVNSNSPNAVRTSEATNRAHMVVGGSATINGGYVAKARSWIKFGIPNNVADGASVISAKVQLRQYDGNRLRMEIKNACNFDEWNLTWNNQPCIGEYRGDI